MVIDGYPYHGYSWLTMDIRGRMDELSDGRMEGRIVGYDMIRSANILIKVSRIFRYRDLLIEGSKHPS